MIDIHDSLKRFESARRRVASLDHARLLLAFLDHLEALGLSKLRVAKCASALCTIFRSGGFNPAEATKRDVERVVAWINRQTFKEWTKHDLKLALRKLVQFAKHGSCDRKTPIPDEVAWIPLCARGYRFTEGSSINVTAPQTSATLLNAGYLMEKKLMKIQ